VQLVSGRPITRYIIQETAIGTLFNAGLSFAFAYMFFREHERIAPQALISDSIPQTFAVVFFAVLVPTILTRKRIRDGRIDIPAPRRRLVPGNALLRALGCAVVAAAVGFSGHWLALRGLDLESVSLPAVLTYKPIYGALVTWLVTPLALRATLSEVPADAVRARIPRPNARPGERFARPTRTQLDPQTLDRRED
jgi:hypothetical protein